MQWGRGRSKLRQWGMEKIESRAISGDSALLTILELFRGSFSGGVHGELISVTTGNLSLYQWSPIMENALVLLAPVHD